MKKIGLLFFIFCFSTAPAFAKNRIPELSTATLPKWKVSSIVKKKLPNGLQLYLLPDRALPLFKAKAFIKVGSVYEDLSKKGLSDLTATVLATGGTKEKSPGELDEWLESRAIQLSADSEKEMTTVGVSSLAEKKKETLEIFKAVLRSPRFDPARFALAKDHYQEALRRSLDHPHTILARNFREFIYGGDSRWGKQVTLKTIRRVRREDLLRFYQKYFRPDRMIVVVAGDFSPAEIAKWFEANFGDWPAGKSGETAFEEIPFETIPGKKEIHRKLTQAFIEVGHLGLKREDKERYAYSLLHYILGGDVFTSRLGKEIRTKLGLAYSVYSDSELNPARGFFKIHVETKAETKEIVLQKIIGQVKNIHEKADITPQELARAKEALLNQYIFWFDSPFDVVETQAKLDLLGYDPDYLQKYPERIRAVTLEDMKKVAKEYIRPEGLKIVVVGP